MAARICRVLVVVAVLAGLLGMAPEEVGALGQARVFAGGLHTCAVSPSGVVKCWGYNSHGQLGYGDTLTRGDEAGEMGSHLPAVDLGEPAASLALGWGFTCALLQSGGVKCWGDGSLGRLGQGDEADRGDEPGEMGAALPVIDLGGEAATGITAGDHYACALLASGKVKCWGLGYSLGLGTYENTGDEPGEMGTALPYVDLGTTLAVTSLSAGSAHTCALFEDDSVKCWGYNDFGQLGLGDTGYRGDSPGEMGTNLPFTDLGQGAAQISVGVMHSCAVLLSGDVKCWGRSDYGQLGQGDTTSRGDDPGEMGANLPVVDLGAGETVVALEAGGYHTCALLDSGPLKCWGAGFSGQLGLGNSASLGNDTGEMGANLPGVDLGEHAVAVSGGHSATCAVLESNGVKCWGYNDWAQLGLGDLNARGDQPGEMGDRLPALALFLPTPPRNPIATRGDGEVTLAWQAPVFSGENAVADYVIEYRAGSSAPWVFFDDGISAGTAATITGLANGTRYQFRVAAITESGRGDWSVTALARPTTLPGTPAGVLVSPRDAAAFMSWSKPATGEPIGDYLIQYRERGATAWLDFADGVSPARGALVAGLANGTTYQFRVAALNAVGQGPWSAAAWVQVGLPTPPRHLTTLPGDGSVQVNWWAPLSAGGSPIDDYAIQFRLQGSPGWISFADGSGTARRAEVTGLTNGLVYEFRVAARNSFGRSLWSAVVTATPGL